MADEGSQGPGLDPGALASKVRAVLLTTSAGPSRLLIAVSEICPSFPSVDIGAIRKVVHRWRDPRSRAPRALDNMCS